MAATASRPYEVTTPQGIRLVEAINSIQAIRHCLSLSDYKAEPANGKRVGDLMAKGIKYETAGQEVAATPTPDLAGGPDEPGDRSAPAQA